MDDHVKDQILIRSATFFRQLALDMQERQAGPEELANITESICLELSDLLPALTSARTKMDVQLTIKSIPTELLLKELEDRLKR